MEKLNATVSKNGVLVFLAVLSGAFGINYEILYYRLITSRFGDMLHVHAAILATFLFGIAFGALVAERFRKHLWLMEFLVGASAVGVTWFLNLLEQSTVLQTIGQSRSLTVGVCMVLVVFPAILVGLSIPLFTNYLASLQADSCGSSFRFIYAFYNLGAFISIFTVEYILVCSLGHRTTLYVIAGGNMMLGFLLYFGFPELRAATIGINNQSSVAKHLPRRITLGLILLGLASSLFQMIFSRTAMEMFSPGREIFTLTLGFVLLGFPLGSWARRWLDLPRAVNLAAIAIGISFWFFQDIRDLYLGTMSALSGEISLFSLLGMRVIVKMAFLGLLGLIPFTCFGSILPILLTKLQASSHQVGRAMFACGIGNSLGYLVFILLVNRFLKEVGQVLTVIALLQIGLLILLGWPTYRKLNLMIPITAVTTLSLLWSLAPGIYFRHHFPPNYRLDPTLSAPGSLHVQTVRRGSDNAGIVRFVNFDREKEKKLFYLGFTSITAIQGGRVSATEVLSGVLPAVVASKRSRACVFGIGTGITAGTTACLFDHTDAVEINEGVINLLPEFADANFDLVHNPHARVIHDDARTFLLKVAQPYDVILNSVSVPNMESASKIYTTEFFQRVKNALEPKGVYMTWVGLSMNDTALLAVIGSLKQVFRYCLATYLAPGYFMLSCSDAPIHPQSVATLTLPPHIAQPLAQIPGLTCQGTRLLDSLHLTNNFFGMIDTHGYINTDDLPITEFVSSDPKIPTSILSSWLSVYSDFLKFNIVTGKPLSPSEVIERCACFQTYDLTSACSKVAQPTMESLNRKLIELGSDGLTSGSPFEDKNLFERVNLLRAMYQLSPRDAALKNRLLAAYGHLATVYPENSQTQYENAILRRGIPELAQQEKQFRYRAIVLDARYRNFVTVR
ncbi:MAG: hypothetical protein K1Y36_04540 [Blastocatellia bacterium]|nr:hypothetical protein [Blastocatellia bacterium]